MRNGSGAYTLPSGNPVVAGTDIESEWANTTLADIAAEIGNSLDRSGRGGMLAPFKLVDGTSGVPGLSFNNEPSTGFARNAAGVVTLSILGTVVATFTENGLVIDGDVSADSLGGSSSSVSANNIIGVIPVANLGTGIPSTAKFLRGDGVWSTPPGGTGTGGGTVTSVGITAPASGIAVSGGPITASGNMTLTLTNDLAAVENLSGSGFAKRTGDNTWAVQSTIALNSDVSGNLSVSRLNSGVNATSSTFWRGDGVWASVGAGSGGVTSVAGKVGVVTLVPGDVGLGNVDNTTDAAKPVSTATQTALNAKANIASPAFSGSVTINGRLVGFVDVPRRTDTVSRGECLSTTAGFTLNTAVMAAGYTFTVYNNSASPITVTQGSGVTLRLAGTTTTGNRTIAARGLATIWCESGTEAIMSGAGVA
jgi:hypothetical protein